MQIKEKTDEVILREIPFGSWAIGLFVLFIFGIIAVALAANASGDPRAYFGSANIVLLNSLPRVLMAFLLFVFVALMLLLGFSLLFTPIITAKINRNFKSIEITRRRFAFKRTEKYFFSQVKDFRKSQVSADNSYEFVLFLVLTNDDEIEVTTEGKPESEIDEIAQKLNSFIKAER